MSDNSRRRNSVKMFVKTFDGLNDRGGCGLRLQIAATVAADKAAGKEKGGIPGQDPP